MDTLTPAGLAPLLTDHAAGSYADEAAIALLIGHDHWLHRHDFLEACVNYECFVGNRAAAWVDWDAVPAFLDRAPCSSGEARMLRLAAELGGTPTGEALSTLLVGLDDANARLVIDAITHVLTRRGRR